MMRIPLEINGSAGSNRNFDAQIPARTDYEAIQTFIGLHGVGTTKRAYTKELERFYNWSLLERGKALSDLSSVDMELWRRFLTNVPEKWCCKASTRHSEPSWRPFVGQLSESSKAYAIRTTSALLDWLAKVGYLKTNPCAPLGKMSYTPRAKNTEKALSINEIKPAWEAIKLRDKTPTERRQRLVIALLFGCGLRSAEILGATTGQIEFRMDHESGEGSLIINVVGKGNKERSVPFPDEIIPYLDAHFADRGFDGYSAAPKNTLLIASIDSDNLTYSGLYLDVKTAFTQAALVCDLKLFARLSRPTPHWMRHSHAMQFLASGGDIVELREQLGHSSITTTSIYTSGKLSKRVKAAAKLSRTLA
jgi:site-specific recombinase XerD